MQLLRVGIGAKPTNLSMLCQNVNMMKMFGRINYNIVAKNDMSHSEVSRLWNRE